MRLRVRRRSLGVVARLAKATKTRRGEGRHPWPKYLGGAAKQNLVRLSKKLHRRYHEWLDEVLPRWKGKAFYDQKSALEKAIDMKKLASATRQFDAKQGTELLKAMKDNGFGT